jgi:taurine dioxygenase
MSAARVRPLTDQIGAEVTGIALRGSIDSSVATLLREVLDERGLVVLRTSGLSPEDQIAIVSCFGVPSAQPSGSLVSYVSNAREDASPALRLGPLTFHSDYAFTERPLAAISLYAEQIAPNATHTRFANARRAVTRLRPSAQRRLATLTADHFYDEADVPGHRAPTLRRGADHPENGWQSADHPVLIAHPRTGAPVLYVNFAQTQRIVGLSTQESAELLDDLFSVLYADDNVYEHHWSEGDLVVWDNIALQHGRSDVVAGQARSLRRVVIDGVPLSSAVAQ